MENRLGRDTQQLVHYKIIFSIVYVFCRGGSIRSTHGGCPPSPVSWTTIFFLIHINIVFYKYIVFSLSIIQCPTPFSTVIDPRLLCVVLWKRNDLKNTFFFSNQNITYYSCHDVQFWWQKFVQSCQLQVCYSMYDLLVDTRR